MPHTLAIQEDPGAPCLRMHVTHVYDNVQYCVQTEMKHGVTVSVHKLHHTIPTFFQRQILCCTSMPVALFCGASCHPYIFDLCSFIAQF